MPANRLGPVQVGDGARHLEDAVIAARRQPETLHHLAQQGMILRPQSAMGLHGPELQPGVDFAGAGTLAVPRRHHPLPHGGAGLATNALQFLEGDARHLHLQVDTVQQWAGDAAAVALHLFGTALAAAAGIAPVAAGTGVHGRHQLETGRELRLARGPGDEDVAGLQGFAQHLQHAAVELRQFIEEQHALVGQGDLPRPWLGTTTHQSDRRGTVVGGAEGTAAPVAGIEARATHRGQSRRLQGLVLLQLRQDAGQAAGQQALAGAGRSHHEQAVTTGRGHLQRAPRLHLATHLGQVRMGRRFGQGAGELQVQWLAGAEMPRHLQQVPGGADARILHQGRLRAIDRGQHQLAAGGAALQSHGDHAARRAQLPGQGQFADELISMEGLCRHLPRGGQDAEGDGQVEMAAFLGQFGGRQVDGDAAGGKFEPAVEQGTAHPVLALAHGGLGQAHDGQGRQAVGQVHLDGHQRRLDSQLRAAEHHGE